MLAQLIRIAPAREQNRRFLNAACIVLLLAYFVHFALPALRAGFGEDEMMNLHSYWFPGALRSIRQNFCFWSISYPQRPAGALYYLPLYHLFRSILCRTGSFRSAYLPPRSLSFSI
jgi:hypothetical protein